MPDAQQPQHADAALIHEMKEDAKAIYTRWKISSDRDHETLAMAAITAYAHLCMLEEMRSRPRLPRIPNVNTSEPGR